MKRFNPQLVLTYTKASASASHPVFVAQYGHCGMVATSRLSEADAMSRLKQSVSRATRSLPKVKVRG